MHRHVFAGGRDAVLIEVRNFTGREPTLAERYAQWATNR